MIMSRLASEHVDGVPENLAVRAWRFGGGIGVAGVVQSHRQNLAVRMSDNTGSGNKIHTVRQSAYTIDPPFAQILARDPDAAGQLGLTHP
jgi:hypothetical protein